MKKSTMLAFLAGAAVGSVATWQFVKKKYELIAEDEIMSVKDYYQKKTVAPYEGPEDSEEADSTPDVRPDIVEKPNIMEYAAKIRSEGYNTNYSVQKEAEKKVSPDERPYVITPEEFGEYDDYEKITLFFYADQILADDNDVAIRNIDEIVGVDSLTHFGEYDDDAVYVRDDRKKLDYEILKSLRKYSEVLEEKPYKAEVE